VDPVGRNSADPTISAAEPRSGDGGSAGDGRTEICVLLRGPGLDVVLRGLSMVCTDEEILQLTAPLFDGLYEYQRRALLLNRPPA
jgi:hypothetical protein